MLKTLKVKALGFMACMLLCMGLNMTAPVVSHAQGVIYLQHPHALDTASPLDTGTATSATPDDFSGYASTFALVKADIVAFISTVGLLAIGAMIVGKLFPTAWRLTGKAIGSIGKG